jgi:Family of unknown function (DUF6350)
VLVTAITQSIRSVLFTLIPAGIITFIAWAIAGSTYASTTDPFRGAVWIFLGAHEIPFNLKLPPSGTPGWLTYLPLGAIALPIFGIASGVKRVSYQGAEGAKWLFAFFYIVILELLALAASNEQVSIRWYWILAFAAPLVFLVTFLADTPFKFSVPLIYLTKIWALLLGGASLLTGISLMINFKTVHQLTTVLQPGFIGGILFFALTLLYLPNFLIATLSYFVGTGFAIGRDTLISPFNFNLGKIPALPILGALPTGRHPMYVAVAFFVVAVGALVAYWTLDSGRLVLRQTIVLFIGSTFVISYLGSGALITSQLGTVGPSLWKFPIALSLEFLLGVGFMRLIPILSRR